MDRLSILLTLPVGATLIGTMVIAIFTAGLYGWIPILVVLAIGLLLCWPISYLISQQIKRRDKGWTPPSREKKSHQKLPEV